MPAGAASLVFVGLPVSAGLGGLINLTLAVRKDNPLRLLPATMCRWFAYLSNSEASLLEDVLIDPAHSLAHQVSDHYLPGLLHHEPDEDIVATEKEISLRNRLFNADGLGVVW